MVNRMACFDFFDFAAFEAAFARGDFGFAGFVRLNCIKIWAFGPSDSRHSFVLGLLVFFFTVTVGLVLLTGFLRVFGAAFLATFWVTDVLTGGDFLVRRLFLLVLLAGFFVATLSLQVTSFLSSASLLHHSLAL
jgi:hypothetical protein